MKDEKGWRDLPIGGLITEPGSAEKHITGTWRTYAPIFYEDRCIQCYACWIFCPDNAILTEDGKITGINYHHCKGCGICAFECPKKANAIEMKLEAECDLPNL